MEMLPAATSLARALMTLGRAEASGVLEVAGGGGRSARVAVVDGMPRAVAVEGAEDRSLGDYLVEDGALDAVEHARALESAQPWSPVGRWLIGTGVASVGAVAQALRRQMRDRVRAVFRWPGADYRFQPGPAEVGVPHLDEPLRPAGLVLDAMREAAMQADPSAVRREIGGAPLALNALGENLLAEAPLWPEEALLATLLRSEPRGRAPDALLALVDNRPRAVRLLWSLRVLQGVTPPRPADVAYPLLLRKHRQLKHTREPAALLELPPRARPTEARRALRRFAKVLHPDRFAEPALRRASTEVMSALVRAEADLRARSGS